MRGEGASEAARGRKPDDLLFLSSLLLTAHIALRTYNSSLIHSTLYQYQNGHRRQVSLFITALHPPQQLLTLPFVISQGHDRAPREGGTRRSPQRERQPQGVSSALLIPSSVHWRWCSSLSSKRTPPLRPIPAYATLIAAAACRSVSPPKRDERADAELRCFPAPIETAPLLSHLASLPSTRSTTASEAPTPVRISPLFPLRHSLLSRQLSF